MTDRNAVQSVKAARLLFQLPRECRVYTAVQPAAQWGWMEQLTNKQNYLLELLVWMKTKDARKQSPQSKPKPFIPDFMGGQVGKDTEALDIDDVKALLEKPRE